MDRFIIIAKNSDERRDIQKKKIEVVEYGSIDNFEEFGKKQKENLDKESSLFLLVHFGGIDSESELCVERRHLKQKINQENIFVIPISRGAGSKKARELFEKIENDNILEELIHYNNYWEWICGVCFKKEVIITVLTFCLYCESVFKFKKFEIKVNKIKKSLLKVKKILTEANIWKENCVIKESIEEIICLIDNQGDLKVNDTIDFINKELEFENKFYPAWLVLLKKLNKWAKEKDDRL